MARVGGSVADGSSGWEWNRSQPGPGATELGFPRPALWQMQGEAACRVGDTSGEGEEPPPEVVVMTIGINPEVGRTPGGAVRGPGTRVPRPGGQKLRDKGMPVVEIAEVLEVTRASVYRYLSETEGSES